MDSNVTPSPAIDEFKNAAEFYLPGMVDKFTPYITQSLNGPTKGSELKLAMAVLSSLNKTDLDLNYIAEHINLVDLSDDLKKAFWNEIITFSDRGADLCKITDPEMAAKMGINIENTQNNER
jgi:hypothetical protein